MTKELILENNEFTDLIFENNTIRSKYDSESNEVVFSVIDVVKAITESKHPSTYWGKLKSRLSEESGQPSPKWERLKMPASDGKLRKTDVATRKQLFRIIQSIPSPKAEPFKQWLAQVGEERLKEEENPSLGADRIINLYEKKGYDEGWIQKRIEGKLSRRKLTDKLQEHNAESWAYGRVTNVNQKGALGYSPKELKKYKGLSEKENLRDNMSNKELIFSKLGEDLALEVINENNPNNVKDIINLSRFGGELAGNYRKDFEKKTGIKVVTREIPLKVKERLA